MVWGHTSIWLTHKSSWKQREGVCGGYCNVTDIIYLLGRERPRTDTSDCHEQHPGGVRIREYRAATAAFSKGRVCGGVRRKNGLQDRSSGVGRNPLRGTANRQPLPEESCRTVPPPPHMCAHTWHDPRGLGMEGVTGAPPEAWAGAPGEGLCTLPPWAAAAGCFSYSWASCRRECSEARWARAPMGERSGAVEAFREKPGFQTPGSVPKPSWACPTEVSRELRCLAFGRG